MKSGNRSNVLLVEILIAVLFFMLSATVLVQVFITARNMTVRSGVESVAIAEAQNVAETIYAADDIDEALSAMSFRNMSGAWSKDCGDYSLVVYGDETPTEAGRLWSGTVTAFYQQGVQTVETLGEGELFSLTCIRYKGVPS